MMLLTTASIKRATNDFLFYLYLQCPCMTNARYVRKQSHKLLIQFIYIVPLQEGCNSCSGRAACPGTLPNLRHFLIWNSIPVLLIPTLCTEDAMAFTTSTSCAVNLPTFAVYNSRDVLSMTDVDPTVSPYPFGLAIFAYENDDDEENKVQLPMFYVSQAAADDRSPEKNPINGGGVKKGWYVVAKPGLKYEVRAYYISEGKQCEIKKGEENGFSLGLTVDGQYINDRCMVEKMDSIEKRRSQEISWKGFLKSKQMPNVQDCNNRNFTFRQFQFSKTNRTNENDDDDDENNNENDNDDESSDNVGEIVMDVEMAFKMPAVSSDTVSYDISNKNQIDERTIAKKGISLKTDAGSENSFVSSVSYVLNKRRVPNASVTVYVRESSWMESRKIINERGNACNFEVFKRRIRTHAPRLMVNPPATKRAKLETVNINDEKNGNEKNGSSEVLDLDSMTNDEDSDSLQNPESKPSNSNPITDSIDLT